MKFQLEFNTSFRSIFIFIALVKNLLSQTYFIRNNAHCTHLTNYVLYFSHSLLAVL